jgi:hypothetical protein
MSENNPQLRPKAALITDANGFNTANVTEISPNVGALDVNLVGGSAGNPAAGPTGQPVPAEADYVGYNDNGTLVGVSLTSPLPVMDIPIVQNVIVTTGVLANNASVETTAQIPGPFQLLWITASAFCRVRAYSTAAAQAADLSRPSSQTPTPATSTGIISDAVLTSSLALGYLDTYGLNGDTPASNTIYLTITNLSGAPAAISINVAYTDS